MLANILGFNIIKDRGCVINAAQAINAKTYYRNNLKHIIAIN